MSQWQPLYLPQEIQCPQCLCFLAKITKIILLTMVHLTCIGVGYGNGWVTDKEFKKFMQHSIKHVKPSNEYKVLLILDNHSFLLHFETLNLAKENGIVWI